MIIIFEFSQDKLLNLEKNNYKTDYNSTNDINAQEGRL